MALSDHQNRVNNELREVGVTSYGQHKTVSKNLPSVIRENEHIKGAVYGWSANGFAMLVATDHRILYLIGGMLTTSVDELTYEVVSGVHAKVLGIITVIELHTRIGNYVLTNVNAECAKVFVNYIEQRVENIEDAELGKVPDPTYTPPPLKVDVNPEAHQFLIAHELAVLATSNQTGDIWGSVVYYLINDQNEFFILTKPETTKAHNMLNNRHVSLTIYDPLTVQTAQIQGQAEVEDNQAKKDYVHKKISEARSNNSAVDKPEENFLVFHIKPTNLTFHSLKA